MDTKKLIHETINFGNPFEAIEMNFFTYQELTDYLASNYQEIPKNKLYLTFTALQRLYHPEFLYSMGKHLLYYLGNNDLMIQNIYVVLGGSPELPLCKDDPNQTLWSMIFDVYSNYVNDVYSDINEKAMLLCNKVTLKLSKNELLYKDENFIKMLYEYRCDKVISMLKKCCLKPNSLYAIESDWFEMYPNLKKNYQTYIEHVDNLRTNAPLYYSKMIESFLNQLCTLTLRDFERIEYKLLKKTCLCFPQQFTDIEIDEKYQRICIYPLSVRAYVLGLSCFPRLPSKKQMDEALVLLSKIGIEEYVKHILESQQVENINSDLIANTEDTLYEKPSDYLSLDRFHIEENGKIYQFTSPEFKKLYSDKKNFWTKQPISYSDLYTLQLRIQMCQTLILPASDTYQVILEKACKGALYEEPLTVENNEAQNNHQVIQQYQNYLTTMFHAILNGATPLE